MSVPFELDLHFSKRRPSMIRMQASAIASGIVPRLSRNGCPENVQRRSRCCQTAQVERGQLPKSVQILSTAGLYRACQGLAWLYLAVIAVWLIYLFQ
jgi:hypothetical protein